MHSLQTPQGMPRRPKSLVLLFLLPSLLTGGCASLSNTEKGVGVGGLIGAGTGAIVGSAVGRPGAGAAIGAGVGALSGGLVGNAVDESEKKQKVALAAAQQQTAARLGLIDVVQLTQQHISDDVVIGQIRSTGSIFYLSSQDIVYLKQNGVSDGVIREMQTTASRPAVRRVYGPPPPVVFVETGPPPVSFGFGYQHYGRWR